MGGLWVGGLGSQKVGGCGPHSYPMPCPGHPGWICYAEKTHGNLLVPLISTARSPQQVMGVLVKDFFAQRQVSPWQAWGVGL